MEPSSAVVRAGCQLLTRAPSSRLGSPPFSWPVGGFGLLPSILQPEFAALVEHFRRTDPRYDRRVEVDISADGQQIHAVSLNVSLGGIFVETDQLLSRADARPGPISGAHSARAGRGDRRSAVDRTRRRANARPAWASVFTACAHGTCGRLIGSSRHEHGNSDDLGGRPGLRDHPDRGRGRRTGRPDLRWSTSTPNGRTRLW